MTENPKRAAPLSWRVTPEERQWLDEARGDQPMGQFLRLAVFNAASPVIGKRGRPSRLDHKALAAVLAKLGQSRIPNNLNELAKLANAGSLGLTPDVAADILEARRHVEAIRRLLDDALSGKRGAP